MIAKMAPVSAVMPRILATDHGAFDAPIRDGAHPEREMRSRDQQKRLLDDPRASIIAFRGSPTLGAARPRATASPTLERVTEDCVGARRAPEDFSLPNDIPHS